ncbi:unnamed protein product [Lathyrus sativus]|nr:unnamed protein product [Lathyrus sativus]
MSPWKGRLLSIGGRVTLINSVLTNFPIHHLSFFKASWKVLGELISLQRYSLWHGTDERKGMAWVSWDSISKTKEDEGFGLKDLRLFNRAWLEKWLWRFLTESDAIWKVYVAKPHDSLWWKDVLRINSDVAIVSFGELITIRLGDDASTLFWTARWMDSDILREQFPGLYSIAARRGSMLTEMRAWDTNG